MSEVPAASRDGRCYPCIACVTRRFLLTPLLVASCCRAPISIVPQTAASADPRAGRRRRARGASGTYFRSDIQIVNLRNAPQRVQMYWLPQGSSGSGITPLALDLAALRGFVSEDFVANMLSSRPRRHRIRRRDRRRRIRSARAPARDLAHLDAASRWRGRHDVADVPVDDHARKHGTHEDALRHAPRQRRTASTSASPIRRRLAPLPRDGRTSQRRRSLRHDMYEVTSAAVDGSAVGHRLDADGRRAGD